MRFILLSLLTIELCARSVAAQSSPGTQRRVLTLTEARSLAEQVSPEIAAARAALRAAEGRTRQAGAMANPVAAYAREQTSGSGARNTQDIITLEQQLEIGGQRGARRAAAQALGAVAGARLAAARAGIRFEVARAYAQAVAADRRATLAGEAAKVFIEAGRVGRERLAAGDMSGYEHRRIRLEAARYAAHEAEAQMIRTNARRSLATFLSAPDHITQPESLVLTDTLMPDRIAVSADSLVTLALARRPELLAAHQEAGAAMAEARLARAERIPTPTLGAGYKHERALGGASLGGFVAQLSLPLPLWDRRAGAVQAADAEAGVRQADIQALRRRTEREVRDGYESSQALATQIAAIGQRLDQDARTGLRAAQVAYREGETSLVEWLDAVRAYQEVESTHVTLWAEYIARRAELERATGTTLF
jgi:outer membrane protein, heavy metal efflux system